MLSCLENKCVLRCLKVGEKRCSDLFSSCVLCVTPGLCSVYDCQLYRKMGMLYTEMGVLYRKMGCCTERWDVVHKEGCCVVQKDGCCVVSFICWYDFCGCVGAIDMFHKLTNCVSVMG